MNQDDKKPIRVEIYARVSTTDQVSTGAQIEALRKHIKDYMKDKIIHKIIVESKSAKDVPGIYDPIEYMKLRPKFYDECYLPATRKEYEELAVWKWDRLARSKFQPIIIDMFNDSGVKVWNLIDSNDPFSRDIQGRVNQEEINKIKQRVELRHQELLQKKRVLNRPVLGYKFKNKKLIVDEENREAVIKMFQLTLQGLKPKEICSQIIITRKRKHRKKIVNLPIPTYLRLLNNKTYTGVYQFRGEERKGIFETPYKDLFEKVQEFLKAKQ